MRVTSGEKGRATRRARERGSSRRFARVRALNLTSCPRPRARFLARALSMSSLFLVHTASSSRVRARMASKSALGRARDPAAARGRAPVPRVRATDDDASPAPSADPWLDARRLALSALTVDKGLKPLCRGYGLKLSGSKPELVERALAYESANRAEFAPMEAVVERATKWRNSRVLATERVDDGRGGSKKERSQKRERSSGGWGRSRAEDDGESWGSEWTRSASDVEDEGESEDLLALEAKYPALTLANAKVSADDLARRVAVVNGLRQLARERKGYEADTALHLEAIARAVEKSYRDMVGSALTILQKEGRRRVEVSVDIDVGRGRFAVLAQVIGRSGAVEREYDDTKFFNFNIRRQNRMRPLIGYLSEEIKDGVARRATEDFVEKVGTVCEGAVRFRSEDGAWMVDIDGGAAGVIPAQEQLQALQLKQGDRVTCFVLDVENNLFTGRERTPVILSMTIPGVVAGIIEREVPEVASGDVLIKAISRIPGKMTKVAVTVAENSKTWSAIDACVGPDNERLRRIRERAGGEIVHFIQWSDNVEEVVKAALFPAEVKKTEYSFPKGERLPKIVAYVSAFDSSRAIGAGGANVKLAAALTNTFVVIEKIDAEGDDNRRRANFNDDVDDAFDSGSFWGGRSKGDTGFDRRDAEDFTSILSENRFSDKKSQGMVLDDLGWPELPELDDLKLSDERVPKTSTLKTLGETLGEDDFDEGDPVAADDDSWEIGPGRPGLVTFGATGRPGLIGTAVFFGDVDFAVDDDDVVFD